MSRGLWYGTACVDSEVFPAQFLENYIKKIQCLESLEMGTFRYKDNFTYT